MEPAPANEFTAQALTFEPKNRLTPAAIKLREWMISTNTTAAILAMKTGVCPSQIKNLVSGQPKKYPSLAQAFAMEFVTAGAVEAWEWLENPYIDHKIRMSRLKDINRFENSLKRFVLKFNSLKTNEGMIRHKARILSRMFGVQWGEVRKRAWQEAHRQAKLEEADISHLMEEVVEDES